MRIKISLLIGAATLSLSTLPTLAQAPVVYASSPGEVKEDAVVSTRTDDGAFDYGYAAGASSAAVAAEAGPTRLLTYEEVKDLPDAKTYPLDATDAVVSAMEVSVRQPVTAAMEAQDVSYRANPYAEDPIYVATTRAAPSQATLSGDRLVTVQPGDTVYALGRRYGVKPNAIISANRMEAPYALSIGQEVIIPGMAAEPARIVEPAPRAAARPVTSRPASYEVATTRTRVHVVQQGNTLYSISRAYGLDVPTLARANNIPAPYTLDIGQRLIIPAQTGNVPSASTVPAVPAQPTYRQDPRNRNTYIEPREATVPTQPSLQREAKIVTTPTTPTPADQWSMPQAAVGQFAWPVQGEVIMGFGLDDQGRRNDGINIAAPVGTPIRSVSDGEVVYRGSDLDGYGNLLLIKHADNWVSAYAHTDTILVRKGESVRKGQVVAKVGRTGSVTQPQLHFELRHELKPTNPLTVLEQRVTYSNYQTEQ